MKKTFENMFILCWVFFDGVHVRKIGEIYT